MKRSSDEMDDETTRRADLVFIASGTLLEAKAPDSIPTPSSALTEWTSITSGEPGRRPSDPERHGRAFRARSSVFSGSSNAESTWNSWIIWPKQRPNWTFPLIGRVALPEQKIPQRPNIRFIGKRPYESLPAYGKQFDAAIIPYRQTKFNYHANPLKLREYLAMGKPVVTVSTPEIDKYADVVEIAHSRRGISREARRGSFPALPRRPRSSVVSVGSPGRAGMLA